MKPIIDPLRICLAACIALFALLGASSYAQDVDSGSMRLSSFTSQAGPIRLTDVTSSIDLFVPVSGLVSMRDARVELRFGHSIALLPERSFLVVRMNDIAIAQIPFDPLQPRGIARFTIPDDLWRPGFNRLAIGVIQHYTDRCEDSLAPGLWTELDLHESRLEFLLEERDGPLTLSDLDSAFGPGIGAFERVTLLSPAGEAGHVTGSALPLVAQSLALRRRFMPLVVEHVEWSRGVDPDATRGPRVLVGTVEQLAGMIGSAAPDADGPRLVVSRTPAVHDAYGRVVAPSRLQLIVTGRTSAEVVEAARILALMDDALNPVAALTVREREHTPAHFSPLARLVMHPDRTYRFADLGLATHSMRGFGAHGIGLDVRLPGDFYTHDSAQVELELDLAYGAGMGPGSVVNVLLNGEFVHGRLLDEAHGAMFHRYLIVLPARRFMPGNNRVEFEFTLRPEVVPGECAGLDGRHLVAQIMGSSTITLPGFGRASPQPNLRLFGSTGFPFNGEQAAPGFDMYLADHAQIGSALTLIGRIAQATGAPHDGWRLHLGFDSLGDSERSIVLAPAAALPEGLFDGWSLAFGRLTRWPYAALNDARAATQPGDDGFAAWLVSLLGLRAVPEHAGPFDDMLRGSVTQVSGLGAMGGLSLLRNPLSGARGPVLVVTAEDDMLLRARVESLIRPQVWSQLNGGLVLWQDADTPVVSARVVDRFEIGQDTDWLLLRLWLSNQPWYWLALVVAGTVLLVLALTWLVRRRKNRLDSES